MPLKRFLDKPSLTTYLLFLVLIAAGMAGLGMWLGRISVGDAMPPISREVQAELDAASPEQTDADIVDAWINPAAPPLAFYSYPESAEEWNIYFAQVEIAAAHGLHLFMMPIKLRWQEPWDATPVLRQIETLIDYDPHARLILEIDLDPPASWLAKHAGSHVEDPDGGPGAISPASNEWRRYAGLEMQHIAQAIRTSAWADRIAGYTLAALDDRAWLQDGALDRTPANRAGFRTWLLAKYGSEAALLDAWRRESLPATLLPDPPNPDAMTKTFLYAPADAPLIDYQRYRSENTADAIAQFAATLREAIGDTPWILARYGYSLEDPANNNGHHALGQLMTSELDGFISPVSYANRGIGGTGGPMGPIDAARLNGKLWFLLDDTRTGVARDPITGAISRLEGLRADDVFNVQARNFALAASRGLGIIWADPFGEGWLHDTEQWKFLQALQHSYCDVHPEYRPLPPDQETEFEDPDPAIENPPTKTLDQPGMIVVMDEASRAHQRAGARLNTALLRDGRDAAMQSGVPVRFVLYDDFVAERVPEAPVYYFLNTFEITDAELVRLHSRFAAEGAAVIWQYAPGYIRDVPSPAHIAETTRINVRLFDEPEPGGSRMILKGRWIRENEPYGLQEIIAPLFHIQDEDADTLGAYEATEKSSLAMKTLEDGWTSVYLADPRMTPTLLREILRILEQHSYFRATEARYTDTAVFGNGLFAIHSPKVGERITDLEGFYQVNDLLDPAIGWPQTDGFPLPLSAGQTRILQLRTLPTILRPEPEAEALDETDETDE